MKFDVIKSVKTEQELMDAFDELHKLCDKKGLNVDDYDGITGTEFSPLYYINHTCKANGDLCTIIFMQEGEKKDCLRLVEYDCKKVTLTVVTDWYSNAAPLDDVAGAVVLFKERGSTIGDIYFDGTLVKDANGYDFKDLGGIGSCLFAPYDENKGILGVYAYTGFIRTDEENKFANMLSDDLFVDVAPMFRKIDSSLDFLLWFDAVVNRMADAGYLCDVPYATIYNLRLKVTSWLETVAFKGKEI